MTQFEKVLRAFAFALFLTVLVCAGCHRGYYRRMADTEAQNLVLEKSQIDPRYMSEGTLSVDPGSRMFDPFSRDHPPIPPDDPQSHQLMKCVDGRTGYPHWHSNGDSAWVENPEWMSYLPRNEEGVVVIDTASAVELAYLHSGDFQRQREELYLSALDVSLERFGFDSQLFAGFNSFLGTEGRIRGGGSSRTTLSGSLGATGGGVNYRKLTSTGATFAVGLANSILWNFAGNNTQTASSLINFSLIQPLLRGGGRDRILESLTQAERTLLANVRQIERYNQGFHLQIVTGRNPGPGPNRGGSFLGLPTSSPFGAGGILGLLEAQQQIRFAEFNVQQQQDVVDQFREFFLLGQIDSLQVTQAESTLYSAQASLLQQRTNYQNQLDRFKQTLGLPPWLELKIEDDFLKPFELIDASIQRQQASVNDLREVTGTKLNEISEYLEPFKRQVEAPDYQPGSLNIPEEADAVVSQVKPFITQAISAAKNILATDPVTLDADLKRFEEVRGNRIRYLQELKKYVDSGKMLATFDPTILAESNVPEIAPLREQLNTTTRNINELKLKLEELDQGLANVASLREELDAKPYLEKVKKEYLEEVPRQLTLLNNYLIELSLTQAKARSNSIEVPEIDLDAETATSIARCLRLDWMNARASLVDNWRQIEVVANQLESQLDFVLEGSMGTVGDNPFKVRYENGNLRGGFRFDTPLTRLAERNQYRQALVRYQQARRAYYQFEDEASRNLRQVIRTIDQNRILFELNRISVQVSIKQIEAARFKLDEPARFTQAGAARTGLGATTARDLTGAISGLNRDLSAFLGVWVEFEVLRRNLDYDLGTFQLDQNGQWIDPGKIDADLPYRFCAMLGLDPSCRDCEIPPQILVPFDPEMVEESELQRGQNGDPSSGTDSQGQPNGSDGRTPARLEPEENSPPQSPGERGTEGSSRVNPADNSFRRARISAVE